jgi:hypothetical protein
MRRRASGLAGDSYGEWAVALAILTGVVLALVLLLGLQEARAKQVATRNCGDVVVRFAPEGSGGAHDIRATGIGCEPAQNIARACVNGVVTQGWTAVTWKGRVQLTNDGKKVRYTGVGGGGCGLYSESCSDFSYRGVGFFNPEVLGVSCGSGKSTAKAWYDHGGNCSFGHTCELGGYRCKGNPNSATVNCTRENGFRVRWQMGE